MAVRPDYIDTYGLNWEQLDVVIGGRSALDAHSFVVEVSSAELAQDFLVGYGLDPSNPVHKAELFGNFQEALQFIRRYFLKEGHADGLDLTIPPRIFSIVDTGELFLMASGRQDKELAIWAGIILKVMHTILHADKDLRHRYFKTTQQQIFDRFYKFLNRDDQNELFLFSPRTSNKIYLHDFQTKATKTRDSVIIKLLHKAENVAEEVFDRVGIRFVTKSKYDTLRVVQFLLNNYVIMPHNVKPSRSQNTLIDMGKFRLLHFKIVKDAMRLKFTEEQFLLELEKGLQECRVLSPELERSNAHSSVKYKAIHFTCRQLIKYTNPFMEELSKVREFARKQDSELAAKVLALNTSALTRETRFFYPFEIQITDVEAHKENTEGEASHLEYKRQQLLTARDRLFRPLVDGIALGIF